MIGKLGNVSQNSQLDSFSIHNNKHRGKEIMDPFTEGLHKIRYLWINLNKEVKDFYDENFKSLKKEVKKNIHKWKGIPIYW